MSEERTGQEPGERDDLDELLEPDEPEDDPDLGTEPDDTEPEPELEPEPEPPASRASRRITRQQAELRELRETNKRLLDAVTRQPAQPQYQQQPDPARQAQLDQQEAERVAQMPLEQQGRYWADKRAQEFQQRIALTELRTADMLDRNEFKQIMRERRLPARYATEVENLLAQARQQNMNPSREDVLYRVIGREWVEKKDRETDRQRIRGQRRIASQTTRPSGTRSTAASAGGRRNQNQAADDEALLRGVSLGDVWNSTA